MNIPEHNSISRYAGLFLRQILTGLIQTADPVKANTAGSAQIQGMPRSSPRGEHIERRGTAGPSVWLWILFARAPLARGPDIRGQGDGFIHEMLQCILLERGEY